ncbi:DUF5680 domain-containing protein [Parageobacillus sp. KH3-4]|uniref:DUF5680 domain-containing protein n=1 Tax=Parageobacillus sp. KH3-4 TaxID=2916802 RepID=UPI002076A2A1|nr:DUF5680 domain-containing protein [Parageobacillus sp. KH3-4]
MIRRSVLYGTGQSSWNIRNGDDLYRDIYFGSVFFAGQEVVEEKERTVLSMVYSGGIVIPSLPREQADSVYTRGAPIS